MSDKNDQMSRPSPMRILRAWLFRERACRGPAAIELDVVERQVERETASVTVAAGAAAVIERKIDGAKATLRSALADGILLSGTLR